MCLVRLILTIQLHNHYFVSVFRFFYTRQSVTGRLIHVHVHVCLICLEFNCEQFTVEVIAAYYILFDCKMNKLVYLSDTNLMKSESVFNSLLADNYLLTFFLDMC